MLLAQELGVSLDWLVLGKVQPRARSEADHGAHSASEFRAHAADHHGFLRQVRHLPVLAWQHISEKGLEAHHLAESYLPCPRHCGPRSFALRPQGDSMFPCYLDGEFISVDPDAEAGHNKDVILLTPSGASFKRLQYAPDGCYLLALNPDHPQRMMHMGGDCQICGVVIASYMER